MYFRNGQHLQNCQNTQCKHMFKCPNSYCIVGMEKMNLTAKTISVSICLHANFLPLVS